MGGDGRGIGEGGFKIWKRKRKGREVQGKGERK